MRAGLSTENKKRFKQSQTKENFCDIGEFKSLVVFGSTRKMESYWK
jgi:hypothetical protein